MFGEIPYQRNDFKNKQNVFSAKNGLKNIHFLNICLTCLEMEQNPQRLTGRLKE